jgi:hypothetical protein
VTSTTGRVLEFKGVNFSGGKSFTKIAVDGYNPWGRFLKEFHIDDRTLKSYMIKELKVEDLPLYVSWHTYPRFVELLKGEPHKTRTFSKSSQVISRRQEYEAKRIVKELKSVK